MTPIPGPIILLAFPLAAAVITYLVRRWAILAALIAALTTGALAALCLRLPLGQSAFVLGQEVAFGRPVIVVGRNLVLDPAGQVWLAFIFALATLFYLFAWRVDQGRTFFSFSLVILSLYAFIVLLQTFSLVILVFAMSATPAVFIIQSRYRKSIRGAQRYLIVLLLAVPMLLAATWLIEQSLLITQNAEALANGSTELSVALSQALARRALLPTALGFGLLLAIFPFGTWMPALAADAPPIVTAFLFTTGQAMAIYLALVFLQSAPWLLNDQTTLDVIQFAGLIMVASGGVMAAVQRDFGRVLGYAALSSLGFTLLAFGLGGSQGLTLSLLSGISHSLAVALMAAGLAILRYRVSSDRFADLGGVARRLPIATIGLILGGLALAGFPLTGGFPTHWAVLRSVAGSETLWALVLFTSSIGIIIGLLRGLNGMLGTNLRDEITRQPILASAMVLLLAGLVIVLGLYPQLFLEPVSEVVAALALH
jgi:formate hydrogenlyase subunit 3/multisubunit Na+/H+ antiporter MnhD subunit